jgi:hypothetical protein
VLLAGAVSLRCNRAAEGVVEGSAEVPGYPPGTVAVDSERDARAAGGRGGGTLIAGGTGGGIAASASMVAFMDRRSRRKSSRVYPVQSFRFGISVHMQRERETWLMVEHTGRLQRGLQHVPEIIDSLGAVTLHHVRSAVSGGRGWEDNACKHGISFRLITIISLTHGQLL